MIYVLQLYLIEFLGIVTDSLEYVGVACVEYLLSNSTELFVTFRINFFSNRYISFQVKSLAARSKSASMCNNDDLTKHNLLRWVSYFHSIAQTDILVNRLQREIRSGP